MGVCAAEGARTDSAQVAVQHRGKCHRGVALGGRGAEDAQLLGGRVARAPGRARERRRARHAQPARAAGERRGGRRGGGGAAGGGGGCGRRAGSGGERRREQSAGRHRRRALQRAGEARGRVRRSRCNSAKASRGPGEERPTTKTNQNTTQLLLSSRLPAPAQQRRAASVPVKAERHSPRTLCEQRRLERYSLLVAPRSLVLSARPPHAARGRAQRCAAAAPAAGGGWWCPGQSRPRAGPAPPRRPAAACGSAAGPVGPAAARRRARGATCRTPDAGGGGAAGGGGGPRGADAIRPPRRSARAPRARARPASARACGWRACRRRGRGCGGSRCRRLTLTLSPLLPAVLQRRRPAERRDVGGEEGRARGPGAPPPPPRRPTPSPPPRSRSHPPSLPPSPPTLHSRRLAGTAPARRRSCA